jgi:hypothetical protein
MLNISTGSEPSGVICNGKGTQITKPGCMGEDRDNRNAETLNFGSPQPNHLGENRGNRNATNAPYNPFVLNLSLFHLAGLFVI